MTRSKISGKSIAFFATAPLLLLSVGGWVVAQCVVEHDYRNCVVIDKDRTTTSKGSSDMRIYTENCGTLSVEDNMFKGVWDSADIYASIEVGESYDFTATGWRIPLLSLFPGIIEVRESVG